MNNFFRPFFALFFSALFVLSVGLPASAQDIDMFYLTDRLQLQYSGGDIEDHTNDAYATIVNRLNPSYANDPYRGKEKLKADINRAFEDGTWMYVQSFSEYQSGKPFRYYALYFNYSRDCDVTLNYRDSAYFLDSKPGVDSCAFRKVIFDAITHSNYSGDEDASHSVAVSVARSQYKHELFLYSGDYKLGQGLENSGIDIPKNEAEVRSRPLFFYRTNELNFWGVYVNNVDKMKPFDQQIKLNWFVYNADHQFKKQGDPVFTYRGSLLEAFNYDFSMYGKYIVTVSFDIPAPILLKGISPLYYEFQLDVDGGYYVGDGITGCDEGVCTPPILDCAYYKDFSGRLQCEMRSRFNFGLINPSLTAFKDLLLSFTVKNPVKCNLSLPDVTIHGRAFGTSQIGTLTCNNISRWHSAFPFIAIFSNFVLAFLVFSMVARIINDLTNPDKHNIVEGV